MGQKKTIRFRLNGKWGLTGKVNKIYALMLVVILTVICFLIYNTLHYRNLEYLNLNLNTSNNYTKHSFKNLYQSVTQDLKSIGERYMFKDESFLKNDMVVGSFEMMNKHGGYSALHLLDKKGKVLYSTNHIINDNPDFHFPENYKQIFQDKIGIKLYGVVRRNNEAMYMATINLLDAQRYYIGKVIVEFSLDRIIFFMPNTASNKKLSTSKFNIETNTLLLQKVITKGDINDITNDQGFICVYPENQVMNRFQVSPVIFNDFLLDKVINKGERINQMIDLEVEKDVYVTYLVSLDYVEEFDFFILSLVKHNVISALILTDMYKFILVFFILFLLAVLFGYVSLNKVIFPIYGIIKVLNALKKGEIPQTQIRPTHDELNVISDSLVELIENTKKTAKFAESVGKGNLKVFYNTLSENDVLGTSLVNMRNGLIRAQERDNERNWIVSGNAEVSQILRIHDNVRIMTHEVIKYLTEKINAIQGAVYVTNQEKDNFDLDLYAVYAYGKIYDENEKNQNNKGLIGQVAIEKRMVLLDKIPGNYFKRTSGILGDSHPKHILALPMIYESKVYGVLEFAGFNLDKKRINIFLQEVAIIIARTINNIFQIEQTNQLLVDVQQKREELLRQQTELKNSNFEKQKAQIQLQKINTQLEDQIEEVNKSQQRMQLLLENASEVITVYEESGIVRYVSYSVKEILGFSPKELVGKNDLHHLHEDSVEMFGKMFDELISNPFKQVTIQVQYLTKTGDYIWAEATGVNKLKDPAVEGIIVNLRNITERRRAEEERRIRSKMQALSENSTDLILRIEYNNTISYINPIIQQLTSLSPEDIRNKPLELIPLQQPIVEKILKIKNEVWNDQSIVYNEFPFMTQDEERIMIYSGIPEFDENRRLESVLIVFHDITEQKNIEREVRMQNKKNNDSINYASRIQEAILPELDQLKEDVADAFFFYKARDVVTGDFPWYRKIENKLYIAACDCTGHGVPGALISLIGFFHLNDVVSRESHRDLGYILGRLNDEVTKTFKQDSEYAKSRDGMDVGLCRICLEEQTIEFSGAHRPIFILKKGEFIEIKGDRCSIGGSYRYRKVNEFQQTKIKIDSGDSFFIFSDGLTDQFGGNEQKKKKFGVARLRQIFKDNREADFDEIQTVVQTSWNEWKLDTKQTDDVLLIGVKF